MKFTTKGIPRSLRPAFQEYDLEQIDPEEDAFTVIERALTYGNREELAWLFSCWGNVPFLGVSTWLAGQPWRSNWAIGSQWTWTFSPNLTNSWTRAARRSSPPCKNASPSRSSRTSSAGWLR